VLQSADRRHIHPGQPARRHPVDHDYGLPQVVVVDESADLANDCGVIERGRKVVLRGTWTLRQYRNPTPCGALYVLTPDPGATYEWESVT
jgi:hypothetical protein